MRRGSIRNLPFRHNLKPGLGFEIFHLSDLVARVPGAELAMPLRPEFHLLLLGLRGRGSLRVDFTSMPIAPQALTVLARGRVQQLEVIRGVEAWLLLVSPEFIALDPRAVDPLRAASVLSSTWATPSIRLSAAEHRELVALCEQLAAEQARPLDAIQPALLQALLRALLLRAERLALAAVVGPAPSADLQRFFTILDRDCTKSRSVGHYAKAIGISARRLGKLVIAHTGKSTKEVVDERVILEQQRLLTHTDVSVKELADRTGFAEPTNLVKFFRHHTGTTPRAFRKDLPSGRRS